MADNLPSNDNLESFFQESFKGFGEDPPEDLWDSIEANIPLPPSKKGFFASRTWLSVAALLVLVFGTSVFAYKIWLQEHKITNLSEQVQESTQTIEQLNKTIDSLKDVLVEDKKEKNNLSNNDIKTDVKANILADFTENEANNVLQKTSKNAGFDKVQKMEMAQNETTLKANSFSVLEEGKAIQKAVEINGEEVAENNLSIANFHSKNKSINDFIEINKNLDNPADLATKTGENTFYDEKKNADFGKNINENNYSQNNDSQALSFENKVTKPFLTHDKTIFQEKEKVTENNFAKKEIAVFDEAKSSKNLHVILPLASLKIDAIDQKTFNKPFSFLKKKTTFPEINKPKKQRLTIGFYVAPTLSHHQLKVDRPRPNGQNPPPFTPNDGQFLKKRLKAEEKAKISFRFGTSVAIPITRKISIETGLQYEKVYHTQRHLAQITYTENNAITDENGNITNVYKYDLDTSYGEVEVDFEVTNSPQNNAIILADGDIIPLHFKSQHELTFFSMPLLIAYSVLQKNKVSLQVKTGIIVKHLAQKDINIKEVIAEKDCIRPNYDVGRREFRDLRRTNLDYQIGLAVNYHLNSKINLSIQPTFMRAFKAIHAQKNIKTIPMQTSINIGFSYNL
ncbi:MAG: hypothetical protein ACPG5B_10440 [Chitinophagales bacterium]